MRHHASAVAACVGTLFLGVGLNNTAWASSAEGGGKLGYTAQQRLEAARDQGQRAVMLLVAAVPGQVSDAASMISSLGGRVLFKEDSIDYLRVVIDTELVEAAASLPSVSYVDLDETLQIPDPRPSNVGFVSTNCAAPVS